MRENQSIIQRHAGHSHLLLSSTGSTRGAGTKLISSVRRQRPGSKERSSARQLTEHGLDPWRLILKRGLPSQPNQHKKPFRISDVGGAELLAQAAAALDTIELLAEAIQRDGATFQSRSGPRVHPGVKDMLAARSFVCKTLQRLGITDEAIKAVGRPAGGTSGWLETIR
jgi:hypothetical protein